MSFFDDIEVEKLGLDEDKVGGSFAKIDKTGFYNMTIEKAYVGEYDSGAKYIVIGLVGDDKAKLSFRGIVSSGREKGCKSYYMVKDKAGNETGEKRNLPDYSKMKALDELLTSKDRAYPALVTGLVDMYDKDLKKEVPTEKLIISEWIGKPVSVLVKKKLEDDYNEPTKPREVFEVEHFLDSKTGRTRNEIVAGKTGFKEKWLDTYKEDFVNDVRVKSKNYVASESNTSLESTTEDSFF